MRSAIKRSVGSAVLLAVGLAAGLVVSDHMKLTAATAAKAKPSVAHTVIFVMKPESKDKVNEMVSDCHTMLAKLPMVKDLWAGKPVGQGPQAKAFDVGLTCIFEDAEGLQKYGPHPGHIEFAQKWLPHIERSELKVYDFANPSN